MKNVLFLLFFVAFTSIAQTIERKYTDFDLVVNAKKVSEYDIKMPSDKFSSFNKIEELMLQSTTKTRKSNEYSFNSAGYIIEQKGYSTDPETIFQSVYKYDTNNLIFEIIEKESPIDTINFKDFSKIKIDRNGNEATKTWSYAANDTIYSEKFILENNYIIEEKVPYSNTIRQKITYDENYNRLNALLTLASGEQLTWKNSFTFFPNGKVKTQKCTWTDLKTVTTESYLPNGLLQSKTSKNENLDFDYIFDEQGNWIYKIIYRDKKPKKLLKREIVYN